MLAANDSGSPLPTESRAVATNDTITTKRITRRQRTYPTAFASLYRPVPGRTLHSLSIKCPRCGGIHLGRVRYADQANGVRRLSCGRVMVVVRRVYGREVTS